MRLRPHEGPFALSLRAGNADHLHCLNPAAAAAGLSRGMSLADARAFCPGLTTRPADLAGEADFLTALCRWAGRYAPQVARDGTEGLVADITGVGHLFGGEAALIEDLTDRLARGGISACTGLAGTRGAAHALARHGGGRAAPGQEAAALAPLPPSALRIDHASAEALSRLGLRRIADLIALPRAALARRFGPAVMLRLDQALGAVGEPVSPEALPPHYGVRLTLPEPIGLLSDVMAGLDRLLARLCEQLAVRGHGARRLRLELRRVDGATAQAEIGLARAMRDPAAIAPLFRAAVEDIDSGFGFDQLRLSAPVVEDLRPRQIGTAREGEAAGQLADLITRLGNRMGFDRITRCAPAESHLPERSFLVLPAAHGPAAAPAAWPPGPARPVQIFPPEPITASGSQPPAQFRWRRMRCVTGRASGPERIAPEWWLDDHEWRKGLRDYWQIETREGRRLWLFHTPQDPGWYVHGEFL